ncbi:MbtH family protein [Streptomyces sp. NPDC046385]|uniref:MbtH family protein n=1 Tax=Streptomyces sp. NPDC046385 TaxID=3154918 RepID=UPI0033E0128E
MGKAQQTDEATNPFENEAGVYRVLTNAAGEHSLWPEFAEVPAGWEAAFGPGTRTACLGYVEEHWTALAPAATTGQDLHS